MISIKQYHALAAGIWLCGLLLSVLSLCCFEVYSYQPRWMSQQWEWLLAARSNFDGLQYLNNGYSHQPNFAFLPLFSTLVNYVPFGLPYNILLICAFNTLMWVLSINKLQSMCSLLGVPAHRITCMYITCPAAIFFHSVYTESLYAYLSFCYVEAALRKNHVYALLYIVLAIATRSTAVFLLPVVGVPILAKLFQEVVGGKFARALGTFAQGASILGLSLAPLLGYLAWARKRLCETDISQCESLFFNAYSYVQHKHWNVGFMTYYTMNNLLFILIGTPAILFSLVSLLNIKSSGKWWGLNLSYVLLLTTTIFMTNLQSSTRFLSTHPMFYILLAPLFQYFVVRVWWFAYLLFGFILFPLGFPWT